MTHIVRPLRADARRNRERVLTAAAVVFSEHGHEAQMDDVASRAGVGVGTVYRHFPTKEALMEALAVDRFEKVLAAGNAALERDDPWEAFVEALWAGAELLAGDRAFTEIVGELQGPMPLERERADGHERDLGRAPAPRPGGRRSAAPTSCSTTSR